MVRPPFSSLTSSYQPFQSSEKLTDPGQPRSTQPSPSPGSCKRKFDAELTWDNFRFSARCWHLEHTAVISIFLCFQGIFISKISENGPAGQDGILKTGDKILKVGTFSISENFTAQHVRKYHVYSWLICIEFGFNVVCTVVRKLWK